MLGSTWRGGRVFRLAEPLARAAAEASLAAPPYPLASTACSYYPSRQRICSFSSLSRSPRRGELLCLRRYSSATGTDAYRVLGANRSDEKADIKKKYMELVKKYHPDRNPQHANKFAEINAAWEVLERTHVPHDPSGKPKEYQHYDHRQRADQARSFYGYEHDVRTNTYDATDAWPDPPPQQTHANYHRSGGHSSSFERPIRWALMAMAATIGLIAYTRFSAQVAEYDRKRRELGLSDSAPAFSRAGHSPLARTLSPAQQHEISLKRYEDMLEQAKQKDRQRMEERARLQAHIDAQEKEGERRAAERQRLRNEATGERERAAVER